MGTTIASDIAKNAEGAFYTAVGLGILGFQRVQVQRRRLRGALNSRLSGCTTAIESRATTIAERLDDLGTRVEAFVDDIGLPPPARTATKQACSRAREARQQVFGLVTGTSTTA